MEDYPRSLAEFEARFSTEEQCRDYLFRRRWPEGFRCPRCGHGRAWPIGKSLFECGYCGYQCSVTAGTIFHDTRKPLTLWFRAMWWVTCPRTGMSAVSLQEMLGLGSYRTAWAWLHKLRRVMVRPDRDRLSGSVEVDETYLGGLEEGLCGRQVCSKALIVVAAEEAGKATGRIRMRRIDSASGKELHGFVTGAIEKGSVLHTDGWSGYRGLDQKGYVHEVTPLRGRKHAATELLPRVHRAISLLKRWLLGTRSWRSKPQASRLLPRRIYVPIQPANFTTKRQAVLPIGSTSGRRRTENIQIAYRESRQRELKTVTTTYCGHLTKVHTPNPTIQKKWSA